MVGVTPAVHPLEDLGRRPEKYHVRIQHNEALTRCKRGEVRELEEQVVLGALRQAVGMVAQDGAQSLVRFAARHQPDVRQNGPDPAARLIVYRAVLMDEEAPAAPRVVFPCHRGEQSGMPRPRGHQHVHGGILHLRRGAPVECEGGIGEDLPSDCGATVTRLLTEKRQHAGANFSRTARHSSAMARRPVKRRKFSKSRLGWPARTAPLHRIG